MEAGHGKTKAPTLLRLPTSSNGIMRAWLKFYRPALLGVGWQPFACLVCSHLTCSVQATRHEYLFVHRNGSAPRTSFGAQVRALQHGYIGKSATPHAFRGMQVDWLPPVRGPLRLSVLHQVTAAHEADITPSEHDAMCWSRQHTPAVAKRFYNKPTAKRYIKPRISHCSCSFPSDFVT